MVRQSSGLKQSTNWLLFMAYHKLYETKPGRHMIDHEHNQIVVFYQIKILLQQADFLFTEKISYKLIVVHVRVPRVDLSRIDALTWTRSDYSNLCYNWDMVRLRYVKYPIYRHLLSCTEQIWNSLENWDFIIRENEIIIERIVVLIKHNKCDVWMCDNFFWITSYNYCCFLFLLFIYFITLLLFPCYYYIKVFLFILIYIYIYILIGKV